MKKFFLLIVIVFLCIFFNFNLSPKDNKKETVSFSSWGSQSEVKILKEILNDFEKETNITVDFQHIPENYFQKIHLLFASNLAPDVIFINNHYLKMYASAGLLEDLTPYIQNEEKEFHKIALDCLKDNNNLYAIPRDVSALVLYQNKEIIKDKIEPKNIYELKELAEKYTSKNNWGINYEEDSLYWLYYLASNGGGILSDNAKEIIINKEESVNALNLYSDFANKYHIAPTKSEIGSMTTAQMFINGQLAMYLGGRWMVPKFKETIDFKWDIIEFPASQNNKIYIDASGWAISKNTKNKENAIKLIKYLSNETSIRKLVLSGLITPARKIETEDDLKVFTTMLYNAKPTPTNKNYGKINDILKTELESVLNGEKRAENVLNERTIKKLESLL